jgi:hypothetical protein
MPERDNFKKLKVASLYCPQCKRVTETREKLLLVLSTGHRYDCVCVECGSSVGDKSDNDASDFHRTAPQPSLVKPGRRG